MRPRTTEEKRNFAVAASLLGGAALILWLVSRIVTTVGTRQLLVDLALSMILSVIICSIFFLVRPAWFESKWKQPQ